MATRPSPAGPSSRPAMRTRPKFVADENACATNPQAKSRLISVLESPRAPRIRAVIFDVIPASRDGMGSCTARSAVEKRGYSE